MKLTNYDIELFRVIHSILGKIKEITIDKVNTAQDAMLNLRIDWETLESSLRNRKNDGFEPAVEAMINLSSTAGSMAAVLQSKIINQRIHQMEQADIDNIKEILKESKSKPVKEKIEVKKEEIKIKRHKKYKNRVK